MPDPLIEVHHVGKKYAKSLKQAMVYGLADIAKAAFIPRRYRSVDFATRLASMEEDARAAAPVALRKSEFWALQDVNFNLGAGECAGIIGHNGAGKSTLFKILSGIISPSTGSIAIRGRLTSLIEVGSGFHPMLSGRENIYISGAVLGMGRKEIDKKFDEIVAFSGVEAFIDMPVKFYSSGMHVRLGFSVLAHLEPEIMLIDEILAVGDMEFQKKCIDRINRMRSENMAIALVSHNMHRIESLSDFVIWLEHGKVKMQGDTQEIIEQYRAWEIEKYRQALEPARPGGGSGEKVCLHKVELLKTDGSPATRFGYGEDIRVRVKYEARERIPDPKFQLFFYTEETLVFVASMLIDGDCPEAIEGPGQVTCTIRNPDLLPRVYEVAASIRESSGIVDLVDWNRDAHFSVTSEGLETIPMDGPCPVGLLMQAGIVHQDYAWDLDAAVGLGAEGSERDD